MDLVVVLSIHEHGQKSWGEGKGLRTMFRGEGIEAGATFDNSFFDN